MLSMSKNNVISFCTKEHNAILTLQESRYRSVTKHDYIVRYRFLSVQIADIVGIRIEIWKLVKSSKKWKIIKEHWIYHIKLNANNKIIKFKACWMIKNFEQIFSIDYDEIYASTSHHITVWILLTLAVKYW